MGERTFFGFGEDAIEMPDEETDAGTLHFRPGVTVEQLARLKDALGKHGFTWPADRVNGQYVWLSVDVDDVDRLIELLEGAEAP